MKNLLKNLACSAACFTVIAGNASAYVSPEQLSKVNYVVEVAIKNPNMASAYSSNFLGLDPDYNLNSLALSGDKAGLKKALMDSLNAASVPAPQQVTFSPAQVTHSKTYLPTAGSDNTIYTSSAGSSFGATTFVMAGLGVAGIAGVVALAGGGGGDGHSGGGSGGGGLNPTPGISCASMGTTLLNCPQIAARSSFMTTEYNTEYDGDTESILNGIHPEYAYARGITGQGIKIGILDQFSAGVLSDPEIAGKIDVANSHLVPGGDDNDVKHGDWTSKFAAGYKNNVASHGVAYDATLILHSYNLGTGLSQQIDNLARAGAKVINMSYSYAYSVNNVPFQILSEPNFMANALSVANSYDVVITASAGNYCPQDPANCVNPAYPARSASSVAAAGLLIAVGAVQDDGAGSYELTDFSNHAGDAKDFYITVPTTWGTSSAAPAVAGSAALIRQAWPHLTAAQTVQIILTSADDLGAVGVDTTYGHGVLNLERAFDPLGETAGISSSGNTSQSTSMRNSYIQPSRAFGDSFSNGSAMISFADSFNRVYETKASTMVNNSARQKSTSYIGSLDRLGFKGTDRTIKGDGFSVNFVEYISSDFDGYSDDNGHKIAAKAEFAASDDVKMNFGYGGEAGASLMDDYYESGKGQLIKPEANYVPYLNMYDYDAGFAGVESKFSEDSSVSVNFVYGREKEDKMRNNFSEARSMAALLNYKKSVMKDVTLGLTNGFLYEDGTVLGSKTSGAFDLKDGAQTMFIGADIKLNVTDDVAFNMSGYKGYTKVSPGANSVYTNFTDIETDSYSAGVESNNNFMKKDKLMFSFFQGLRVSGGSAQGTFFGQAADGSYIPANFSESLEPAGKEFTLQALYSMPVRDNIDISLAAQHTKNPNNVAYAESEQAVLGKIRIELDK